MANENKDQQKYTDAELNQIMDRLYSAKNDKQRNKILAEFDPEFAEQMKVKKAPWWAWLISPIGAPIYNKFKNDPKWREKFGMKPKGRGEFGSEAEKGDFWSGKPEKTLTFSRFTPEVQSQFDQLMSQLLTKQQEGGFDFAPIEQQAREGFEQKTIPTIAERFTAMGAGGGKSSAFTQGLGQAGSNLESALAALKGDYNLKQQQASLPLFELGGRQSLFRPSEPGFWSKILHGAASKFLPGAASGAANVGMGALGSYFGGR